VHIGPKSVIVVIGPLFQVGIECRVPGFQKLIVLVFGTHLHSSMGEDKRFKRIGEGYDLIANAPDRDTI